MDQDNSLLSPICLVIDFADSTLASALCALAVIIICIGGLFGKVQWSTVIITCSCCGGIIAAPYIAGKLTNIQDVCPAAAARPYILVYNRAIT